VSGEAVGWVWRHSPYEGTGLVVHLAIADVVNDVHGNQFWMSVPHLARKCRISDRQVQRYLRDMEEARFIHCIGTHRSGTKVYVFSMENTAYQLERDGLDLPAVGGDAHVTPPASGGDTGVTGGVTPMSPELKKNTNYVSTDVETAKILPLAAWKIAVRNGLSQFAGRKSWDLLDPYLQAFDHIETPGDAIALVIDYVEQVTGEKCDSKQKAMIAKTVRKHGKVALYAWDKALLVTDEDTPRDRMRYAQGVINRVIAEMKEEPDAEDH
jgi:hypothetical protein